MFSATEAIAKLDQALIQSGQTVKLVRLVPNQQELSLTVRAFVRGYKPDELANGVVQGDSEVILSPSSLIGSIFEANLPAANNKVEIAGRRRNIQMPDPVYMADVLVRINLQVRG